MKYIGLDTETDDPHLNDKGPSWVYGEGEVLCTSLFYEETGVKKVIRKWNKEVRKLLLDPKVTIVGANIGYDIGWLEHEMGIKGQTKATLLDVIAAESLIDEYGLKNLEFLGQKYLKRGKTKSELEEWAEDNGLKGDFRKYLKDAPWDLLSAYAADDAELPVKILRKQIPILESQELMDPFTIDCKLIKIVLKMKQRGVRIDIQKKKSNHDLLKSRYDKKNKDFIKKYGAVNFNSPKQVASLLDDEDVPYKYKFTVKGRNGKKYGWNDLRVGVIELGEVVKGFKRNKDKITCKVEKKYVKRMSDILSSEGFDFIANPSVDKKFLAGIAEEYPVASKMQELKQMSGILSKFLGPNFDRFVTVDNRVHATFNISKSDDSGTISGRFSCSDPNLQQIVSKGELDKGKESEILLAQLCREVFLPEENCWMLKIDYSQIEYRLLVHYASGPGAKEAREMYLKDPSTDYHKFVELIADLERKPAKNCNFGVMYGMGLETMQEAFGWTREFTVMVMNKYRAALPYVFTTMEKVSSVAKARGFITTIGKRRARLRNKDMTYTMLNRLNQGGSADMMKTAMVEADEQGLMDFLSAHITVHDELVCSVPKTKEGLDAVLQLRQIMENCIQLRVPVIAEPEVGPNWYDVHDFNYDELLKEVS
jgi:DNA polymerase I-like protein with 3'-5' exonuclease and polymerase domains